MAGAYRMALSGAKIVIHDAGGTVLDTFTRYTVSVRDGRAKVKGPGAQILAEMEASAIDGRGRNWTITGPDGTTWAVTKPCGCGGSR